MWLEDAKQIPISYINVQLFPREKKKKSIFANVLKRKRQVVLHRQRPSCQVSQRTWVCFSYNFPSWWLQNVHCSQRKHTLFHATMWLSSTDITEEV